MKKTNKKIMLLGLLSAFSVALCGSALMAGTQASADEVAAITVSQAQTIAMRSGASARISEDGYNGLRFTMEMSATEYQGLKKNYGSDIQFGILIAPSSYEQDYAVIDEDSVFGQEPTYDWATWDEDLNDWVYEGEGVRISNQFSSILDLDEKDSTKYVMNGTLSNITANLTTEFVGVGYVQYTEGDTVKYKFLADNDNVRSVAYVAQVYQTLDTIDQADKDYVLATYITGKADQLDTTYTVKHMLSDGNGNYVEDVSLRETPAVKINSAATATSKTVAGYTYDTSANNVTSATVLANGKTELALYYRNNRIQNVTVEDGTYTMHGNVLDASAYYFTTQEASATAVYSVEIEAPNRLVAASNVVIPNAGIIISDGTQLYGKVDGNMVVPEGSYNSIQVGLSNVSLVSHCLTVNAMTRNLDRPEGDRWQCATSDNNYGFYTESTTKKTLTVVIYNGAMYLYVDGTYAKMYSLTNNLYFNTNFTGTTYMLGVQTTNVNHGESPVSMKVVTELYGDEALAEIQNRNIYRMVSSDGTTTSTFSNATANSTVVYSVEVNALMGIPTPYCNNAGHVGIAISNSATPTDVMTIGFSQYGINSACNRGMYRRWDGTDKWGTTVNSALAFAGWNNVGGTLKSGKLTIVIYNNTLYVYAGATTESFVNSGSLLNGGGWINLASFAAGAQWTVGVGATDIYNVNGTISGTALDCSAWGITVVERNRLYGDEAVQYIKDNYSANITVAE